MTQNEIIAQEEPNEDKIKKLIRRHEWCCAEIGRLELKKDILIKRIHMLEEDILTLKNKEKHI